MDETGVQTRKLDKQVTRYTRDIALYGLLRKECGVEVHQAMNRCI